jgi:hypothetical protein
MNVEEILGHSEYIEVKKKGVAGGWTQNSECQR